MITLNTCPKGYSKDQDKAVPPAETVERVKALMAGNGVDILSQTRRIDTGRLGIPVYLSICGERARRVMPTRKQMGKGASATQAEASALMELAERFSFFSFWADEANFTQATYSEAEAKWPEKVIGLDAILKSVNEDLDEADARRVLDLVRWRFYPATDLTTGREVMLPLDWFKKLGEFNGSSAGNTAEESIFQGACELVERHVCAVVDRQLPTLPTIDLQSAAICGDPVLAELVEKFRSNGVKVLLKDFTLGMPVPTVAAVAWDPITLPNMSEIVYTAGTASSPGKAAIRALTEVAQLAGDFETGSVYEASGLGKFADIDDFSWLAQGPVVPLESLPDTSSGDIFDELQKLIGGLAGQDYTLFSVPLECPELGLPAHYNFVPGFQFRERDRHACLGLFVGRILAEETPLQEALPGLITLESVYRDTHFLPFFQGLVALRAEEFDHAAALFAQAEPLQPDDDNKALAAFYEGHALTQKGDWIGAMGGLSRAIGFCDEHKEFFNLRGVAKFKLGRFKEAAEDFSSALDLDSGSAMDVANLGMCHLRMGNKDNAAHLLGKALELNPDLDFARDNLREMQNS